MALFDFFKKGKKKKPSTASPAPTVKQENIQPVTEVKQEWINVHFSESDIEKIVCNYIDKKGLDGLSKEEAELSKPFFTSLFYYYYENAMKNNHSSQCSRNGCDLNNGMPVFLTASKVLCCDCALQYIMGNLHNWHYYFGNLAAGIGAVPARIQTKGTELQKQISELRQKNLFAELSNMSDEEIYKVVIDQDKDSDLRAEAVLKMKNVDLVNKIAFEVTTYPVLLSVLDFPLPKETIIYLSNQKYNTEWANKVRAKALKKLEEVKTES